MVRRFGRFAAGLLLLLAFWGHPFLRGQADYLIHDNSDWWSITGSTDDVGEMKTQDRELPRANFHVLGVDLSEYAVTRIQKRLGQTPIISRGDASTGREQACYRSSPEPATYLIAEEGEVNSAFYLFNESAPWNGRELCKRLKLVSGSIGTDSGVHLGQAPEQVMTILGKPSKRSQSEIIYFLAAKEKTSPDASARCRAQYPEMSLEELRENCDVYDLTVFIRARFVHARLVYLGVSVAETD
jgi:hypothetical protein